MTAAAPIYLDGSATTLLAPEVEAAMAAAWKRPANPASPHRDGDAAARLTSAARDDVAALIGAAAPEILFTSGATEANNILLFGLTRRARRLGDLRRRIAVSAIEHKAILEPAKVLASEGWQIDVLPVLRSGVVDIDAARRLIGSETLLVSLMFANNETGAIQPVGELAKIAHAEGALFHSDAAQAVGKTPIDVFELDVDYLSLSAHKFHGPMGVGALYIGATAPPPDPLMFGGGQQGSLRPGTEPAPLLAGLGAAARLSHARMALDRDHRRALAHRLIEELRARQVRFEITTGEAAVLDGSLSLRFFGQDGESIVQSLSPIASISTGSACSAGQVEASHVLLSMGLNHREANEIIRLTYGRYNTEAEVEVVAERLDALTRVNRLATGDVRQ